MQNNTPSSTKHEQTIVSTPEDVDISIDSNLVELITLLWANGLLTNFSCEGDPIIYKAKRQDTPVHDPNWNKAREARAYVSMVFDERSKDLVLTLIDAFDGLGQDDNSMWDFEFDYHYDHGPRVVVRFPHVDIPKFVSFLRD